VPDSQSRIERYQRRADENLSKAEHTSDEAARRHYMHLAESYLQLVPAPDTNQGEATKNVADQRKIRDRAGGRWQVAARVTTAWASPASRS
jgi:hypothetical protein